MSAPTPTSPQTTLPAQPKIESHETRFAVHFPTRLKWWLSAGVETALLMMAALFIERYVLGEPFGSPHLRPHPYWLVVLSMAATRGFIGGLLAATVASGFWLYGSGRGLEALLSVETALEPILFFGAAALVGELVEIVLARNHYLARKVKVIEEQEQSLRFEVSRLERENSDLQGRLVRNTAHFGELVQVANRIDRADRDEIFGIALELVEEHCGGRAAIFELDDEEELSFAMPPAVSEAESKEWLRGARNSLLVQKVFDDGKAVNGFDMGGKAPIEGPLLIAPLFDEHSRVVALMGLMSIAPERLDPSTPHLFFSISEWISISISRLAMGGKLPEARGIFDDSVGRVERIGSSSELVDRLYAEFHRSQTRGVNLSVVSCQLFDTEGMEGLEPSALDQMIIEGLGSQLRTADAVYSTGDPACYVFVLPGTDLEGAEIVRSRLQKTTKVEMPEFQSSFDYGVFGPESGAIDPDSMMDAMHQRFKRRAKHDLPFEGPGTMTSDYYGHIEAFAGRLVCEEAIADRYGLEYQILEVVFPQGFEITPTAAGRIAANIRAVLGRHASPYCFGSRRLGVLLSDSPGRSSDLAQAELARRLGVEFGISGPRAIQVARVGQTGAGMDIDLLLEVIRKAASEAPLREKA